MPDPIWLDANVVDKALKGDAEINKQLSTYRQAGRPLLIVPAVYEEVVDGNPITNDKTAEKNEKKGKPPQVRDPTYKAHTQAGLKKIGVQVDRVPDDVPYSKVMDYRDVKGSGGVSISDRKVLAQIKASAEVRGISAPQMVTAEMGNKAMLSQTKHWGITSIPHATSAPGATPAAPRVNLSNYPDDPPPSKSGLSRFFKDKPVLAKAGTLGASMLISFFTGQLMKEIEAHFIKVCNEALKEMDAKHPAIQASERAKIAAHKKAYETSLSKLKAPSNAKVAAAVGIALTPDKDRAAAYKEMQRRLSKVKLADGTMGGYADAASAYLNAMADLHEKLSKLQTDLPDAAADIEKRGKFLKWIGDDLVKTYWDYVHLVLAFPVAYYQWMDVYNLGTGFQSIAGAPLSLANAIRERFSEYERLQQELDKELIRVSTELGKYSP